MPNPEGETNPNVEKPKGPETPEQAAARAAGAAQNGREQDAAAALAGAETQTPLGRIEDARKASEARGLERERLRKEAEELRKAGEALGLGQVPQLEVVTRLTEIAYQQDKGGVAAEGKALMEKVSRRIQSGESTSEIDLDETVSNMVVDLDAKQLTDAGIRSYIRENLIPNLDKKIAEAEAKYKTISRNEGYRSHDAQNAERDFDTLKKKLSNIRWKSIGADNIVNERAQSKAA